MLIKTALWTMTVYEVGPVKLLVENGWITGDWSCGKIIIYNQQSRVDCNEKSIIFLFRLVVFIHVVGMTMFVILLMTRKMIRMTWQAVTIGYLFRNNSWSTQNETNRSKQLKRSGRAECSSTNESQANACLHFPGPCTLFRNVDIKTPRYWCGSQNTALDKNDSGGTNIFLGICNKNILNNYMWLLHFCFRSANSCSSVAVWQQCDYYYKLHYYYKNVSGASSVTTTTSCTATTSSFQDVPRNIQS
jgi:hypothetical protein